MNRPSKHDHRSVINYIENKQPLLEGDRSFIYHLEDLVTTRCGRESGLLDALVETMLRWYPNRLSKVYLLAGQPPGTSD